MPSLRYLNVLLPLPPLVPADPGSEVNLRSHSRLQLRRWETVTMAKYRGWAELEEASYLSDLFQQIVTDCRVSSRARSEPS